MMRVGTDVVEISRFAEMKNLDAFVKRVFSKQESAYFSQKKNSWESIAGFYAAKEAFSKYLGSGMRGFGWKDIEIVHDALGKPSIWFLGHPAAVDVSISHSDTVAIAVVCGEEHGLGGILAEDIKTYQALLPKRWDAMHKGDCGRVFLLAGSRGMTGAAALSAEAALRSGSGLVTVGTPESEQKVLAAKLTEAMTLALPDRDGLVALSAKETVLSRIQASDAAAIGPGLGKGPDLWKILQGALSGKTPLVIDADGLNALAEHIDILDGQYGQVVLTPHPGEMALLCRCSIQEVEESRKEIALRFAVEKKVTLLLKGKDTVIVSPRGEMHINPTGNNGMATGGMGDVLTGVIASLLGQGLDGYQAAVLGAFLHGLAGDLAARELGEFGMIAGDVVAQLPYAIKLLQKP